MNNTHGRGSGAVFSRAHANAPAQLRGGMAEQPPPTVANGNFLEVQYSICRHSVHLMHLNDVKPD